LLDDPDLGAANHNRLAFAEASFCLTTARSASSIGKAAQAVIRQTPVSMG
jgi:hypothetical protein